MGDLHVPAKAVAGAIHAKAAEKAGRHTSKLFIGEGPWTDVPTPGEMAGRGVGGAEDGANGVVVNRNPFKKNAGDGVFSSFEPPPRTAPCHYVCNDPAGCDPTSGSEKLVDGDCEEHVGPEDLPTSSGLNRPSTYIGDGHGFFRAPRVAFLAQRRAAADRRAERRMGLASLAEPRARRVRLPGLAALAPVRAAREEYAVPVEVLREGRPASVTIGRIKTDDILGVPSTPGHSAADVEFPAEQIVPYMYRGPTQILRARPVRKAPVTMLADRAAALPQKWARFFEAQALHGHGEHDGHDEEGHAEEHTEEHAEEYAAPAGEEADRAAASPLGVETLDSGNDAVYVPAGEIHSHPDEFTWQKVWGLDGARRASSALEASARARHVYSDHLGAHYGLSDRAGALDLNAYYDRVGRAMSTPHNDLARAAA
jgi:hypothetical protein